MDQQYENCHIYHEPIDPDCFTGTEPQDSCTPPPLGCIRELIETESNYIHALELIITGFAKPLENFLHHEDSELIFGHIRYFHNIHSDFHANLVSNTKAGETRISTCFLNFRNKFLKYGEYCATLSKAQALLDDLTSKNEALAGQLDRCQQDADEGKFRLRDLLSLPMQRILKYHLLLAQLIKDTSPDDDDYRGLKRAHEAMLDLGQYINEVKRDTEAIQIINDIEQTIAGLNIPANTQLIDYGRLVTDGFIRVTVPNDAKTITAHETKIKMAHDSRIKLPHDAKLKQKRYVFVFDKVMLLCKPCRVWGYQYKEALVLSEYEIDTSVQTEHVSEEKWSYKFNLVHIGDQATYSFYAKTLENKNRWIGAIQRAMDNVRPAACRNNQTNHEFLMHTFEKASSCDHCGKLLLGLYYQGYRCRNCFASAHKKCLATIKPCGTANLSTRPRTIILNDHPWFVGRMERDVAQAKLEKMPHGSFLVRVSPKLNGCYVISLNYNSQVKHMRIYVSKDNQLYLSQNRYFKSLIELVSWYEKNSLAESFHMLDACLISHRKINKH